jgi:hypothetical protein
LFFAYLYSLAFFALLATAVLPVGFLLGAFAVSAAFFRINSSICYLNEIKNTCQVLATQLSSLPSSLIQHLLTI